MIKFYSGNMMPKLGLGTFRMTDENNLKSIIKEAYKTGYRHFDTAKMYQNEHIIGAALKEANIDRSDIFITTKIHFHDTKENTYNKILDSLDKLQTDYIDLLLIHWPNHDDNINLRTWQVFEDAVKDGLVKNIGVSNFTRYQLTKLLEKAKIKPVVNQVELHPGLSQEPLNSFLLENDIKIISYGPLMKGRIFEDPYKSVLENIALKYNASIAQIVIAWGLSRDVIMIPKTSNITRLNENFNSKDIKLSDEDINTINKLNTGVRVYSDPSNNIYGKII
ncbi:MAG TPA: aldo/keto reductase [Acholeplasmataceae bacterium]|nr:aldo/keto reductase [Acholeplasmataceae bacterium]